MGLQEEAGSLTTELLKGVRRSTPPCTGNTQALAQTENQAGDLSSTQPLETSLHSLNKANLLSDLPST